MKHYDKLPIPDQSVWDRKTTLFYRLHWRIRYFLTSCHNLIKWAPIIWHDRDWDGAFTMTILQKKIEMQRKYLVERSAFLSINQTNRDMTNALNLIERLQHDYYDMEYLDYLVCWLLSYLFKRRTQLLTESHSH